MSRKRQEIEQLLKDANFPQEQIPAMCSDMLGLRTRNAQKKRGGSLKKANKIKSAEQSQETKEVLLDYINYMRKIMHPNIEWIAQNVPMLLLLLNKVREQRGIVQILSVGQWNKVFKQLRQSHHVFMSYTQKEVFDIYLRNVIQYEFYVSGKELNLKRGVDLTHSIKQGHFVRGKLKQIMNGPEKGVQMYEYEVVVFPKGVDELGIKYEDINLTKIQQECGDQFVEIRIQNPMDYSFNFKKLTNISHKMTIKQYCEYQKHVNDEEYKQKTFGDTLKNGRIYFGVNFEPSKLQTFSQLWKHLQGNFLGYRQPFDLLSYLDQDIPGCSSPQFYLKVKGCWTGGHQQNINMCAVNINHGPDASQWYTIPCKYVEKIRAVLQEKFKCDLYRDQGLWFEKINWFIENGYPIKRILQQKGDIVISGPGTLHWVRSYGIALQSAWNVFPMKYHMIQAALHRHNQNEALRHERAGTIPLKALLIKFLDHQLYTLDEKSLSLILVNIEIWKNKQQRLRINLNSTLLNFNLESISVVSVKDVESVCLICKQEVFMYYIHDWDGDGIACLRCLQENLDKISDKTFQLYIKYDPIKLKTLLQHAYNRQKFRHRPLEISMCDGIHIGKVTCSVSFQKMRKRTYEEHLKNHQQEVKLTSNHQKQSDGPRQNLYFFKGKFSQQRPRIKEVETQTESMNFKCSRHQSYKECNEPRKDYKCFNNYDQGSNSRQDKAKYMQSHHRAGYQKQGTYYKRSNFSRNEQHNHFDKYRNQWNHNHYNEDRRGDQTSPTCQYGGFGVNRRYNTYGSGKKKCQNQQSKNFGNNQYEIRSNKSNHYENQDIQY